jgi:hypothetical protein
VLLEFSNAKRDGCRAILDVDATVQVGARTGRDVPDSLRSWLPLADGSRAGRPSATASHFPAAWPPASQPFRPPTLIAFLLGREDISAGP